MSFVVHAFKPALLEIRMTSGHQSIRNAFPFCSAARAPRRKSKIALKEMIMAMRLQHKQRKKEEETTVSYLYQPVQQ